jgi:hypothetical protein
MITFHPDMIVPDVLAPIETALFVGVRARPALESTQLRWQVKVAPHDSVQLESGGMNLEQLGGALFLTTKEPPPETPDGEPPESMGWIKWIGEQGRQSFQIQLAIARVAFDRICLLAEKGRYPQAILSFKEDGPIEEGLGPNRDKKIWNNVQSNFALISEFTLKYDFGPTK